MASLETLPPDQRAVIDLVLKQGRSYDEIARMLGIDRRGVRERALAAFDALGPQAGVPPERRALITDYLLGQLPPQVADVTRARLGQSAGERAWARVLASELAPAAERPLPEIPAEADGGHLATVSGAEPGPVAAEAHPPGDGDGGDHSTPHGGVGAPTSPPGSPAPQPAHSRPISRRGGIILLVGGAILAAAAVAVAVVLLTTTGGSSSNTTRQAAASSATTKAPASASGTSTTSTSKSKARLVAQINMLPAVPGSKAVGVVLVVKQGKNTGIAIQAQHIPANGKHDAYAVWLYNSPSDSDRLGFVSPAVTKSGVLQAESVLPANAGHFKQILLTDETTSNPRSPGKRILHGTLTGL